MSTETKINDTNGAVKISADAEKAGKLKDQGNAAFAKGNNEAAIKFFSEAIALDDKNPVLYSNRAAAYTAHGQAVAKLNAKAKAANPEAEVKDPSEQYDLAIADALKCIELDVKFVKAYSRHAAALSLKNDWSGAVRAYAAGLAHDPTARILSEGLASAQKHLSESKQLDEMEEKKRQEEVVIGIDLGTTYSAVGVWINDKVVMIPNDRGSLTTPSYVSFTETGKRSVGQAAKNQGPQYPRSTIFDVKRFIGQRYEDPGVEQDVSHLPYPVIPSDGFTSSGKGGSGKPMVEVDMGMHGKKQFAAEEISAMVLAYLKKCAETYLKHPVTRAVITVPAYFNDSQRTATKAAGRIAGLDVLRIINEPTAAALSYGLDRVNKDKQANVLIFDLGGGTFDVSVLSIESGITEVKATGGDTRLGGEDFDLSITRFLIEQSIAKGLPDVTNDPRAVNRIKQAVENAKRILSQSSETDMHIEALFTLDEKQKGSNEKKKLDFNYKLTRAEFEKLNMVFFNKCLETVKKVLKDAKMKPSDIHDVVLVGGSTRIPKIQEMLSEYFGGKELCKSLNPDEAVAYGAAVQGAILNGARNKATDNMLLMDVTPLSLGIETTGRVMSVIIPRNTPIPCVKTQTYTTEENYQTSVDVCVYEGERVKTDQNNLLGKFTISGIERAKRGEPKVDVSFALDSNGILNVTAKDQKTGAEAHIEIANRSRTSDAEIERMVKDAERYRREDEERLKHIEAKNELEALIYEVHGRVGEMTDAKKAGILETAAAEAQQWVEEHGDLAKIAEIKLKRRNLENLFNKNTK